MTASCGCGTPFASEHGPSAGSANSREFCNSSDPERASLRLAAAWAGTSGSVSALRIWAFSRHAHSLDVGDNCRYSVAAVEAISKWLRASILQQANRCQHWSLFFDYVDSFTPHLTFRAAARIRWRSAPPGRHRLSSHCTKAQSDDRRHTRQSARGRQ